MGWTRTDCFAKPLSGLFEKLGSFVGSYPFYFFVIPLILSAALGGGFTFLKDREDNNLERQFTPRKGPSKATRYFVQENFPYNDSVFSEERLYNIGNFASVIAVATNDSNILANPAFEDVIRLNDEILNIRVDNGTLGFNELCVKTNGECASNVILEIIMANETTSITYPEHTYGSSSVYLGTVLGGVVTDANSSIISAKAVKLFYYLESKGNLSESSKSWLRAFKSLLSTGEEDNHIKVCIPLLLLLIININDVSCMLLGNLCFVIQKHFCAFSKLKHRVNE